MDFFKGVFVAAIGGAILVLLVLSLWHWLSAPV